MIKHETEENVVAPNAIEAFFPPLAARTLLLKRLKTLNIPNQESKASAPGPPPPGADEVYWTAILWFLSVVLAKSVELASVKRRNIPQKPNQKRLFHYKGENPTK